MTIIYAENWAAIHRTFGQCTVCFREKIHHRNINTQDSLICFILWKWNVSKTTQRNDCLFSGQQTESRPVNVSPEPTTKCTNAVFLLFCKKVPLKARAAVHSRRLSCQSAANSSATNVQNWLLLVDTNCIYTVNVSKYKCTILKLFYLKRKKGRVGGVVNATMFVTLCVTGSSPLVCADSYWVQ